MIGFLVVLALVLVVVVLVVVRHRASDISDTELDRRLAALLPADSFESDDERIRREASLAAILGGHELSKDSAAVDSPALDHGREVPADRVRRRCGRVKDLAAKAAVVGLAGSVLVGLGGGVALAVVVVVRSPDVATPEAVGTVGVFGGAVIQIVVTAARFHRLRSEEIRAKARAKRRRI